MRSLLERDLQHFGAPTAEEASLLVPALAPGLILVRFDRVYGQIKCYPANAQAETLARIAGTRTLKPETIRLARALGLTVRLALASFGTVEDFEAGRLG